MAGEKWEISIDYLRFRVNEELVAILPEESEPSLGSEISSAMPGFPDVNPFIIEKLKKFKKGNK